MKKILVLTSIILGFILMGVTSYASDINLQTSIGDIEDGTKDFDNDNEPGHDQNDHNGIVRSFDTISYPIKIVANSTGKQYENIQVKITGTIDNAILNGSQQATFSTGTSSISNNQVTLEDNYLIERTGSAVSVPEIVSVLGAKNGTKLKAHFTVQIVKIDGKDVTSQNIKQTIDTKEITVSSKPNIDITIGKMHTADLMPVGDLYNVANNHDLYSKLGITIGCKPLPEHGSSLKGAAYPSGKVKFSIKSTNRVEFDDGTTQKDNDYGLCIAYAEVGDAYKDKFNTLSTYTESDSTPLNYLSTCVKGTISVVNSTPKSSDKYTKDPRLEKAKVTDYVKDSGQYQIDNVNSNSINVSTDNYSIGNYKTICGYLDVPRTESEMSTYNGFGDLKPFSSQQLLYRVPYKYGYNMSGNKDNKANTFYSKFTVGNVTSIEDGKEVKYNVNVSTEASYRYTPDGDFAQSSNWAFSDGRGLESGNVSAALGSHHWLTGSWGDSMTYKSSDDLSAYTYAKAKTPIYGLKTLTKWNPDSFELSNTDNWYYDVNIPYRTVTWKFGVEKNSNHSEKDIFNKGIDDFTWYNSYDEVPTKDKSKIAAVLHTANDNDATYGEMETRIHIKLKSTVQGNYSPQKTPNFMASKSYGKVSPDAPEQELTKSCVMKQISLYDENGNRTQLQSPVNGAGVIFDNLYVTGSRTYITHTADKKSYNSDETQSWKVSPTYNANIQKGYTDNVKIEVTLDKGLVYKDNSAYYESNGKHVEPNISTVNGHQVLTWNFPIDNDHRNPEIIHYSTVSDPTNLTFNSSGTVNVKNTAVISANNDISPVSSRTASDTTTLRKIEMIGIMHSIDKNVSELNDGYQLTIKPYTTKPKETNVTGIWHVPSSKYHGTIQIAKLTNNLDGTLYVNTKLVTTTDPNKIDVTKDGWEKYTNQDLSKIKSVYYIMPELTSKDNKTLVIDMKASDNQANDIYQSQVFGNSSSNYQTPIMSNIVTNTVHNRVVSGVVWRDDDHNGLKDSAEKLLPDIELSLYSNGKHITKNLSGKDISTVKTDKNGYYEFTDLPAGTYYVKVNKPDTMNITTKDVGDDESLNSKFTTQAVTDNIELPTLDKMNDNYTVENRNLGLYYRLGTIKVKKTDRNNQPLVGATFRLYASEDDVKANKPLHYKNNQVIYPEDDGYDSSEPYDATSDADGWVIFNNIPLYKQKDYVIKEIKAPKGYSLSMETTKVNVSDDNQTGLAKIINDIKHLPATGSFKLLGIVIGLTTLCIVLWFIHHKRKYKK